MNPEFDRNYWTDNLQYPDWYVKLERDLNQYFFPVVHDDPDLKSFRHKVYNLFEELLEQNKIPLAGNGPDLDVGRKNIDTLVIHHTEEDPDTSIGKISAIGLIRLYTPSYLANEFPFRRGDPVWSGHFLDGKQIFVGYHWLIQQDGVTRRLLQDKYLGWHAGNSDINARSVALVLAGNYEHSTPPITQLVGVAEVIRTNYAWVDVDRIFGHREVRNDRTCPGDQYLSGWRVTLLEMLR